MCTSGEGERQEDCEEVSSDGGAKEGVQDSLRFSVALGLVFSDVRPSPYVRPAFSSSASMFCQFQEDFVSEQPDSKNFVY